MEDKNKKNPFKFEGEGSEFFGIWIVNILLSVITLGIYSAWAKVRTNQYFYGNTKLDNDGFEYHAKPMQILKGRIVAAVCLVAWSISNQFFPIVSSVLILAFLVILPWLAWSNARFDAAMTSYRNVHFSFAGTLKEAYIALFGRGLVVFALFMFGTMSIHFGIVPLAAVLLLSVPFAFVWVTVGISNYFANGYRYGKRQFSAEYTLGDYMKIYLKAMLFGAVVMIAIGAVVAIVAGSTIFTSGFDFGNANIFGSIIVIYIGLFFGGVVVNAYKAAQIRNYTFAELSVKDADNQNDEFKFESTLDTWSYVGLIVTNFLLQLVTLGIARPWVMVRTSRYLADNTYVIGDLSNLVVEGEEQDMKSAISDEISEAFDVNIGIG
ncbi:YjgN family protein [Vibrio nigripulchritudo]|uniref:YjgN family protein n=1 Tax=Vibrio nigripulchritudo TaxID=28173 RepID=UPI0003B1BE8E|nr:YjgN family protein [Vibrio nigripulchritudo]BCL68426.1 membrane protein [Vibrio nigripulchritudo]BDU29754.1 membrane protein [Vibrio nigripulchritudo]CCN69115.1 conserved hypothetical protein [Vibrio nigripulchritudo SFn118]